MKVLIIHASIGSGHRRAALALKEVFDDLGIDTEVRDLLEFLPQPLRWFYPWSYDFMIEDARWIWRMVFDLSNLPKSPYTPATSISQKWQFSRFKRFLQQGQFTDIVGTHFTPCALLTDWRKQESWNPKIYSVITDYSAHRCWLRTGLDRYFVASNDVREELMRAGVDDKQVTASGIPVSPAFSRPVSREEARRTWKEKNADKIFLVMTSGLNLGGVRMLVQDLKALQGNHRYLVSAAKDGERVQKIQEFCRGDERFEVFGFSPRIPEMMSASDLILSKPGGLIVSEALAMSVPQILFSPIPGQEEANARYLEKENAAMCIDFRPGEFKKAIEKLLTTPDSLSNMSQAARRLGHPEAARTIVEAIVHKD